MHLRSHKIKCADKTCFSRSGHKLSTQAYFAISPRITELLSTYINTYVSK